MRAAALSALLFATGFPLCSASSLAQTADIMFEGGPILTMAGDEPVYVEMVAVEDGRIIYAGSAEGGSAHVGPETQRRDLDGRAMLPGFVDPHGHMVMGGLQASSANMLAPPDGDITDIPGIVAALRTWASANASMVEKANLIVGFGYDNAQLKELRHPTKEELDAVSSDIPVIVIHQSGHLASVNSAALALAGYDASTPDPDGGVIQRRPGTQEPNGTLEETAFFPLMARAMEGVGAVGLEAFVRAGAKQ